MTLTSHELSGIHWFQSPSRGEDEPGDRGNDPPDRARWILALGIISLAFGPLGVLAWMAGNACLAAIAEGRADPTCESNAKAGRILGMIALCLFTLKVTVLGTAAVVFWLA